MHVSDRDIDYREFSYPLLNTILGVLGLLEQSVK